MRLTDDMLVGCVIGEIPCNHIHIRLMLYLNHSGAVLGHKLTNDKLFNSNLNSMRFPPSLLKQQVTNYYQLIPVSFSFLFFRWLSVMG